MANVFKVITQYIKRTNGLVLTPDKSGIVTILQNMTSPFNNGTKELNEEVYMRTYAFDYKRANCTQSDFDW